MPPSGRSCRHINVSCSRRSLPHAHASSPVHVPVQTRTLRDASVQTFARAPMISGVMWSERAVVGQPSGSELVLGLEAPPVKVVAVHKALVPVQGPGSVLQQEEEPNHRLPHLYHLRLLLSVNQTIAPSHQLSHPHNHRVLAKEVPAHSHLPHSHLALGAARQSHAIQQAA